MNNISFEIIMSLYGQTRYVYGRIARMLHHQLRGIIFQAGHPRGRNSYLIKEWIIQIHIIESHEEMDILQLSVVLSRKIEHKLNETFVHL